LKHDDVSFDEEPDMLMKRRPWPQSRVITGVIKGKKMFHL
jgi:hypothetical protein